MKFFLGTHKASWLARTAYPLFLSHAQLRERKSFPRALGEWGLDSGAYSAANGSFHDSPRDYAAAVSRYAQEAGNLSFAAIQDRLCVPDILQKTGRSIAEQQAATVQSYLELKNIAPHLPFIPVLQGWSRGDYLHCVELYQRAGVDLTAAPVVGLGSLCSRQGTDEAAEIVRSLAPLRLHGFGFKVLGLRRVADGLLTADSCAWSRYARPRPSLPGCTHKSCANCFVFAHMWRAKVLNELATRARQLSLFQLPLFPEVNL